MRTTDVVDNIINNTPIPNRVINQTNESNKSNESNESNITDSHVILCSTLEYNILNCKKKTNLINANNLDLYREPRFKETNAVLIYRATPEFIRLCTSAGAEIPEVNHPNFYKVAIYLNNLKIEYPSFDEEILFEEALRETDWNLIMK